MTTAEPLEALTDAQLNELFAREVAGASQIEERPGLWRYYATDSRFQWIEGRLLNYCADANAVLPWLHKLGWSAYSGGEANPPFSAVRVSAGQFDAYAPTFARAAVLALIRAKRASA